MVEYILILMIGLIGGLPLAAEFAKAGMPIVAVVVWAGVFGFAVWAVATS